MGLIKSTILSVLLVVAVVIGAIFIFRDNNGSSNNTNTAASATSSKTVAAICEPTQHREACVSSMRSVKPDASIKDYIEAAVKATIVEVRKAINATNKVVVNKDDDPHNDKDGIEGCKDFLQQTLDQLDDAISQVGKTDIHDFEQKSHDFIAWLTGANIYIHTCIGELVKPEYKSAVQNGTLGATQLVENALYIFSKIKEVTGALDITDTFANFFGGNETDNKARSLLEKDSSFPEWVSHADRKLLMGPAVAPAVAPAPVVEHTGPISGTLTRSKSVFRRAYSSVSGMFRASAAVVQPPTAVPVVSSPPTAAIPAAVVPPAAPAAVVPPVAPAAAAPAASVAPAAAIPAGPVTPVATDLGTIIPNVVVALDGSGQFKTITEAVNMVPEKNEQRFIIHIKAGTYNEILLIKKKHNLFLLGDGIGKTIITGSQCNLKGFKTSASATVGIEADFFMARGITFENTAGPEGHQAVALRVNGEKAVLYECEIKSHQDTLYYHKGLQFYKNCIISGTIDFMFGTGRAIIQDSLIVARLPSATQANMISADGGLSPVGLHGLVLQNCKIVAEPELMAAKATIKTYLGRPWHPYAVTTIMQSQIDDFITPEGYSIFAPTGPDAENSVNAIYNEYMNTGPGANTAARDVVTFKHFKVLSPQEAEGYTVGKYVDGATWLPASGVPYKVGL